MSDTDALTRDSIRCAVCEEMVPRSHTVLRASLGRVCWFCHTDDNPDLEQDDWYDDDEDWDDWD